MKRTHKTKKPFYKKWWFWIIIIIFILGSCGSETEDEVIPIETQPVYMITESTEMTIPEAEPLHPEDYTFPSEIKEETIPATTSPPTFIGRNYVVNINNGKIHYASCHHVERMDESNKKYFNNTTISEVNACGYYETCGSCKPH